MDLADPAAPGRATARFCTECGAERSHGSRFCTSCGTPFPTGSPASQANGIPTAPDLVTQAADPNDQVREAATRRIIETVDIEAMTRCGDAALIRGDLDRAEFWFLEVATADADATVRAAGIEDLCRKVLIPAGRLEEAELYARHASAGSSPTDRSRALRTLADIEETRATTGVQRLEYTERWRSIDVSQPLPPGLTQQQHYVRLLAHLFYRDQHGMLDELNESLEHDFMPHITGLIIGMSRSSAANGMHRETAVKAIADWLENR